MRRWDRISSVVLVAGVLLAAAAGGSGRADDSIVVTVTLEQAQPKMVTAPADQSAPPEAAVVYLFRLQNTGTVRESYQLSLTSTPRWRASLPQNKKGRAGPLDPGQVATIPVAVVVPKKIAVGAKGYTTLTATSTTDPQVRDEDTVITTVSSPTGLTLTLAGEGAGRPGETVRYRGMIANQANGDRRVSLSAESLSGWPVAVRVNRQGVLTVPARGSTRFMVEVTVPRDVRSTADALVVTVEVVWPIQSRLQAVAVTVVE